MSYPKTLTAVLLAMTTLCFQNQISNAQSASKSKEKPATTINKETRERCLKVLREGLRSEEFWPAMHAAEALSQAGHQDEVRPFLQKKWPTITEDRQRCGVAREIVRAGDRSYVAYMLQVLEKEQSDGHIHACESLYKVNELGDGQQLRQAFQPEQKNVKTLMSAAALARWGSPQALAWLREALQGSDHTLARLSAWALCVVGDQSDIAAIQAWQKKLTTVEERHFFDNALAVLGEKSGIEAVLKNLTHEDQAIRVYAALTAGEAGIADAKDTLVKLLDDADTDTKIRAAQALLLLSSVPQNRSDEVIVNDTYPATANNPRYSEGSVITLKNGDLLYATTEFMKSNSDFANAQIVARKSSDQGKTWGKKFVIQENSGKQNVMSVTLRYMAAETEANRPLGMFYAQKNSHADLKVYLRLSQDDGETFGDPILVTDNPGYHVFNNDRATRLNSGRWLVPIASTTDVGKVNHFICRCYFSDDNGQTWQQGQGTVDYSKRGAMEPEVFQLNDNRVLMLFRTQSGHIGCSYSEDGGDTWSKPESYQVVAPEAPATLRRIPSTGDLLLIWNNNFQAGAGHSGRRNPLTAAISSDEGKTWKFTQNLEDDRQQTYSYISLLFDRGRVVTSYYVNDPQSKQYLSRFRSFPISALYASAKAETAAAAEVDDKPEVVLALPPKANNPRNSEGDFIQLKDGSLLFIYTHFLDGAGDHAKATLKARVSRDQGKTWSENDTDILDNEGGMNVMSVSLLRLSDGTIGLFYLRKNSLTDCRPCLRISQDEGKTWGPAVECITDITGYYVLNNNRAIQLKTGRLLLPICQHSKQGDTKLDMKGEIMCYLSDDLGKTWRRSKTAMKAYNSDGKQITTQEPGVVELKDGRVLMLIRSDAGSQLISYSEDGGDTWSEMKPSDILSPVSPASIERIPKTGDLLLIWNDMKHVAPESKWKRTPLAAAISRDEGKTWENIRNIWTEPTGWYCYIAIDFTDEHVLLGHCAGNRELNNGLAETHLTRLPLSWLYNK